MGNKPDVPSHKYSPACKRISDIADQAARIRKTHGILVGQQALDYFRLIAKRVKPGPELNGTKALTVALAKLHHLRGFGREKTAREKFYQALERGTAKIGNFQEELGMSREEFIGRLRKYIVQYGSLHSETLDFNENAGLPAYAAEIIKGGLSLPTLLVRISDLSLEFEDGIKGLPKNERLSEHNKQLLARKLRSVYFPFADTIGWLDVSYRLRRNGVLWDDNRKDALHAKEAWLEEVYDQYAEAGELLQFIIGETLKLLAQNPNLSEYSEILRSAIVHDARVKSPAAIVLKEEKSLEIKDMVAVRVVFDCGPDTAQLLGKEISKMLKSLGSFKYRELQDNFRTPKKTGYRAIHTTGWFQPKNKTIPVEIQFMDREGYLDAIKGRSSRLGYKSGTSAEYAELMEAINNLLAPVIAAAADVRGAIEKPVPVSIRKGHSNGKDRTFTVHVNGSRKKIRQSTDCTVADLVVWAMNGPRNVDAFDSSNGGNSLSLFASCPDHIELVPKEGDFNRGVIKRLLNDPRVLEKTKKVLQAHLNSS